MTRLDFSPITFPDGSFNSQRDRDRRIDRLSGQLQYALTPTTAIYGLLSYSDTSYRSTLASGVANRDSKGVRAISGINVDFAGFLRGNIGVGYVWRNYDSVLYRDVKGFSTEAKLEYFYSPLTTFTLSAKRVIEDASLTSTVAYFDNRVTLRADHELLRNLLLNAQFDLSHQDYIGISRNSDIYRISGGGRYLSSNTLGLDMQIGYSRRTSGAATVGQTYDEFRVQFGIVLQR